jgi:CrcB protein
MTAAAQHGPGLLLVVAVTVAGGLGALARTELNDFIAHRVKSDFPYGILAINVIGSFLLGILTGLVWYHGLPANLLTIAGIGVCGGFTTWSTAAWETLALLRLRLFIQAIAYTFGGLVLAVGTAAAGIALAALV